MNRVWTKSLITTPLLALLLSGCVGNAPLPPQGEAVNELSQRQTAYPDKVVTDGHAAMDGTIAENVVKNYRKDAADRDAVRNTINVNIGN